MEFQIIEAARQIIKPDFFQQNEIDGGKVAALVKHLQAGGTIPPAVVAMYDGQAMPLDGHHRMSASRKLGRKVDAYVVHGDVFDELCAECRDAEAFVICDGVKSMQVAFAWKMADSTAKAEADPADLPTLIRGFVIRHAKTSGDYDPGFDPPSARFNGPDPVSLLQAASAIERGEQTQVWSEFGSGCYSGFGDKRMQALHDRIVLMIQSYRPTSAPDV